MKLLVKKFGGTSVATLEKIEAVADRLLEDYKSGERALVVLSAMSGYTNSLIEMGSSNLS